MDVVDASRFTAERAWGSQSLMAMGDYSAKLHWTDQPYRWHVNLGDELFVVLDGIVDMHYSRADHDVDVVALQAGQIALIRPGDRHVAYPRGAARILVIERRDSDV